mmetsp:Transcript_17524/g.66711  ORF Transcript_17524/g.66711 Transcript_17524/m.66711 type:complete len:87 (-) Transcript_17524:319-579(-)|eukprot:scaffold742_cov263-Pinguiococcus_pyrenoidosus.AAC.17
MRCILGASCRSFWLTPSEQVKQQLQGGVYSSFGAAVKDTFQKSGIGGFYRYARSEETRQPGPPAKVQRCLLKAYATTATQLHAGVG